MQLFVAEAPSQVWAGDLTYIATDEGWLYLVGLKDLSTGQIVGYALGANDTALDDAGPVPAVSVRRPRPGLIQPADRGSQYCLNEYRTLLAGPVRHCRAMSRRENCFDNAPIESFWGTLKNEVVYHQR